MRLRLSSGLVLLAVSALLATACGDDESVFSAEVGECLSELPTGSVTEVSEIDCDEPHVAEVMVLFEHEGDDDDFPGSDAVRAEAAEECEGDEFEDFVGVPYDETAIAIAYITPTEETWGAGDRETICLVGVPGEEVEGSLEGEGQEYLLGQGSTDDTSDGDEGDTSLDDFSDLVGACQGGDMGACNELYRVTPAGSEAERIGASCAGRGDESETANQCEDLFG